MIEEKEEIDMEELKELRKELEELKKTVSTLKADFEYHLENLKEHLKKVPTDQEVIANETTKIVDANLPLILSHVDERINQRINQLKQLEVVAVLVDQKLREILRNRFVQQIQDRILNLSEPAVKAAQYLYVKEGATTTDLNKYLYNRDTKPGGIFYANVINPLVDAMLVTREQLWVKWTFKENLEKLLSGLTTPKELDQIHDYLLSFLIRE